MATGGTFYVDTASSGGDGTTRNHSGSTAAYATLSAAEAALQGILTSDLIIRCQGGEDSTAVNLSGWTTTSGRLIVETDDGIGGTGTYDNDGRPTGTSVHNSSLYHIDANASFGMIDIGQDNVTIRYLQFSNSNAAGGSVLCIDMSGIGPTSTDIVIEYNRFYHNTAQGNADGIRFFDAGSITDVTIRGNLFVWDNTATNETAILVTALRSGGTQSIHNNTFVSCGTAISIADADAAVDFTNNVVVNSASAGSDYIDSAGSNTPTFNACDDDLDLETNGANNIVLEASPYSNTFVTYAASGTSGDYTPKNASSALADAGTAISGFTVDMNGDAFGTMDVGCFAFAAAGGGGIEILRRRLEGHA